jgi:hypothetical protein
MDWRFQPCVSLERYQEELNRRHTLVVMPAKAGIHIHGPCLWIPAFAGMTVKVDVQFTLVLVLLRRGGDATRADAQR